MSAVYDAFDTVGITGNRLSSTLPGDKDGTSTYEYLSFDASLYNIFHASLQEVESFDWDSYYTTEGGDVGSENGTSLHVQGWYSDISVSITFSPVTKDHSRCFPVMACIIDPVGDPGLEVYGGIRFGMDPQEVSSLIQMDEVMLNGIGGFETAQRVFTAYPYEKCCLEMIFEQKEETGNYVLTQAAMTSTSY